MPCQGYNMDALGLPETMLLALLRASVLPLSQKYPKVDRDR